jgi:hypothetical protein
MKRWGAITGVEEVNEQIERAMHALWQINPNSKAFKGDGNGKASDKKGRGKHKTPVDSNDVEDAGPVGGVVVPDDADAPNGRDLFGHPLTPTKASASEGPIPDCPQLEIVALYNQILGEWCAPVRPALWTSARAKTLRARWSEERVRQKLSWWENFFHYIRAKCPYLLGEVPPPPGEKAWKANLDWILKASNFAKVYEGNYDIGKRQNNERNV